MPTGRYDHGCGSVSNPDLGPEVVVAGGRRSEDDYLDTVEIYTVNTDSWRSGNRNVYVNPMKWNSYKQDN